MSPVAHEHKAQSVTVFPSGRRIEHCDCGATNEVRSDGTTINGWHTCKLCTHPYGLVA